MFQYGIQGVCSQSLGLVAKLGYNFLTQLIALIPLLIPLLGNYISKYLSYTQTRIRSSGVHDWGWGLLSGWPTVNLACARQVLQIVPVQPHFKGEELRPREPKWLAWHHISCLVFQGLTQKLSFFYCLNPTHLEKICLPLWSHSLLFIIFVITYTILFDTHLCVCLSPG